MSSDYLVPKAQQRFELEIKRSQFITTVAHTEGSDAARSFVDMMRLEMPSANHHCWAYVAGAPDDVFQVDQSDDGEPKGTAGKPILNVLQHSKLGQVSVVVTRFFGGIKLGAGGLVRAYSQSASQALASLETQRIVLVEKINIELPYNLLDRVLHYLAEQSVTVYDQHYTDHVSMSIEVPIDYLETIKNSLTSMSQGQLKWHQRS